MIVSHRHRFVFLKTKKTAGTSLEIALSAFCGPDDVITPLTPPDEAERRRLGHRGPQNLRPPRPPLVRMRQALRRRPGPRFRNHSTAADLHRLLPPREREGYFSFCFDRNPWDRAISLYHWRGGDARHGSIGAFLRSGEVRPFSNYDRYAIDGVVAVDRVYRYEDLPQALAEIGERLALPRPLTLPPHRAKGDARADRRSYRDVLEEEDREWIAVVCAREIQLLGYEY